MRAGRTYNDRVDFDRVLQVLGALTAQQVDYVLIGDAAVNLHGLVRGTEDIDVFVRPEPTNIARLRAALRSVWADPHIDEITAEDLCGDYPAICYGPPDGTLSLDILTRLGTAWSYDDLEAEWIEQDGVRIHIATPRTLIRMKEGTVRPIDQADVRALRRLLVDEGSTS